MSNGVDLVYINNETFILVTDPKLKATLDAQYHAQVNMGKHPDTEGLQGIRLTFNADACAVKSSHPVNSLCKC